MKRYFDNLKRLWSDLDFPFLFFVVCSFSVLIIILKCLFSGVV